MTTQAITSTDNVLPASGDTATHPMARVFALLLMAGTLAGVAWLGSTVFHAFSDAWVAPIHLSPDNDHVISLRLKANRQLAEMAHVEAEIARIDSELEAIGISIERLETVKANAQAPLRWNARHRGDEARGLDQMLRNLKQQHALLVRLEKRQQDRVADTRQQLAAGLVAGESLAREEQALDSLTLRLVENERSVGEAMLRRQKASQASRAYRAELDPFTPTHGEARMPDISASAEHEVRIELELVRLGAERRGLEALRRVAAERLADERALLADIEARPLYRAMRGATDVAFIPYEQLEGVTPGDDIMACLWGLMQCRDVGEVTELLPGEVVTEDPWGELARGRYAILKLHEPDAIREKVLRIRGGKPVHPTIEQADPGKEQDRGTGLVASTDR